LSCRRFPAQYSFIIKPWVPRLARHPRLGCEIFLIFDEKNIAIPGKFFTKVS
jgi:hypothetical protein